MVGQLGVLPFVVSSLACWWEGGVEPVGDASGLVDQLLGIAVGSVRGSALRVIVRGGLLAESCRRRHNGVILLVNPQVVNELNSVGGPAFFG